MIGWVAGITRCARGRHERSEAKVHKVGDTYFSRCRHCGVRMRRRAKRDWVVDRDPSAADRDGQTV